jgi:hypothetical protein
MKNKISEIIIGESKSEYHKSQSVISVEEKFKKLIELQKLHISFAKQRGEKIEEWKKAFKSSDEMMG